MIVKFIVTALALTHRSERKEERGATATEYGLLVALIAFIIIVGVTLFGENLNTFFSDIGVTVGGWNTN